MTKFFEDRMRHLDTEDAYEKAVEHPNEANLESPIMESSNTFNENSFLKQLMQDEVSEGM